MAEEAGEVASCPQCGTEVKQKSMIPVLGSDGTGHRYLCRECARSLIPAADGDSATGPSGDAGDAGPSEVPTDGGDQQTD